MSPTQEDHAVIVADISFETYLFPVRLMSASSYDYFKIF